MVGGLDGAARAGTLAVVTNSDDFCVQIEDKSLGSKGKIGLGLGSSNQFGKT